MKAIAQRRETAALESLVDRVLCHDVRDAAGKVAVEKGARLTATSAATLLATPWDEIHVLAIEAGDLHEEDAGRRLAAAVVGDGVEVKGYGGGQWTLAATRRGLLEIRRGPLGDVNVLEGVSVFTLFAGQPVESGETVAKCKVTPLVIPESTIRAVETTARAAGGLVAVRGFRPSTLGAGMERHGAPARPGSLLWLALWEGQLVLGMPTCGMFSQATTFDLVLPRILAGEHVDNRTIAELGHGGLLSRDMSYRFPPYRANAARGELE